MGSFPVTLDAHERSITEQVARDVCAHRRWTCLAVQARCQHVHLVVSAVATPTDILRCVKAWSSRRLGETGRFPRGTRIWARHGSTVYLWTSSSCERAVHYVLFEQ